MRSREESRDSAQRAFVFGHWSVRFSLWVVLLLFACTSNKWCVAAQGGLEDFIATAGTVARDSSGRYWAYIFWQANPPELVLGRTFAVYAKSGGPSSSAPYRRVSIVCQQTDPVNIEPLLRRGENFGQDPGRLEQDLQNLFGPLMPASTISRAEKVSAVIQGSVTQAEYFQNMLLMARIHPGIAMSLGTAFADIITEQTTYEVRIFDPGTETDQGVVGRVTLEPGAPILLPAPGPPVVVPDTTPKGDLNVKLRWATPDPLRRLGLLHYGFNVWRVTKAFAEAPTNRWDITPPAADVLAVFALTAPQHVKRCNRLPILTDKQFTLVDVANFDPPPAGDPETFYYSDDDGRFTPGYVNVGFTNGAQFYYFVTACDILGRDGAVSLGTLATVCDRNPPLPPDGVRVINEYSYIGGVPNQFLRVIWNQSTNVGDQVSGYWVYRWTNINEMHLKAGNPSNNLIAIVTHTNGLATASYLDSGPGSPRVPADLGRTYWYTVRAQDSGACGPNLSGNSAPAFGVLRDRIGPDAPTGEILIHCLAPNIYCRKIGDPIGNAGPSGKILFRLNAVRNSSEISQVYFAAVVFDGQGNAVDFLDSGWLFYSPGESQRTVDFITAGTNIGKVLMIWAAVVTFDGAHASLTNPVAMEIQEPWINDIVPIDFVARTVRQRSNLGGACRRHNPIDPTGSRTNIVIIGYPSPTSREWLLYRRVDDGPLTLLCHGAVNGAPSFSCEDDGMPPAGATICYYLQVLDEHGNPSPLVLLGCVRTAPSSQLPRPMLSPLVPTGVTNDPGMIMTWFCPTPGVERFEVWVAGKPNAIGSNTAPGFLALRSNTVFQPNPVRQTLVIDGRTNQYDFYVFLTPRIGPGFGPGPQFNVPCSIAIGDTYTVFVKAVSRDGTVGEPSNIEEFVWRPANTNFLTCAIPWPARGLPPLTTGGAFRFWHTNIPLGLTAAYYTGYNVGFTGAVVLVGAAVLKGVSVQLSTYPQWIGTRVDPLSFIFTNEAGERLFPAVLYRYQVPSKRFPNVSGDVVQVTPMMENIAYQITNYCVPVGPGQICYTNSLLWDPYILYDKLALFENENLVLVMLVDTQPVVSGARYKYLVVRFRKNGEIAEVIPTNEIEVP